MRTYKKPTVTTGNPTYMVKDANGKTILVNDPGAVEEVISASTNSPSA